MDLRDFVIDSMENTRQATLMMVKDLTPAQLRWRPGPEANFIAFLLFHVFRSDDWYFGMITGKPELWGSEGWSNRWKLPSTPADASSSWDTGFSWTPEQLATWEPPSLEELLAYGQAVRSSRVDGIRDLDLKRLPEMPRPDLSDWTIARYLQLTSRHEAEHQGQMDYTLGLMRTAEAS